MDYANNPINQEPTQPAPKKKGSKHKELLSTLAILVAAPLIAFLLTQFVFQSYEVDGSSMETTLHNQDRLIVSKTGSTFSKILGKNYIPDRYDIIIFHAPTTFQGEANKQLIKRVIGLPGDRIVIDNGLVTVYNKEHPNGFYPDKEGPQAGTIKFTEANIDETIKDGEVYALGDNRENSLDSRAFGPLESKQIIGTLSLRIFPFDKVKKF